MVDCRWVIAGKGEEELVIQAGPRRAGVAQFMQFTQFLVFLRKYSHRRQRGNVQRSGFTPVSLIFS